MANLSKEQQQRYLKKPNFENFLAHFTPKEKKLFWKNLSHYCSHAISRNMKKMKEASKKMKDAIEGRS